MPSSYPAARPDVLALHHPDGKSPEQDIAHLEHTQAIMDALGINPGSSYGTVANAIVQLAAMATQFGTTGYRNLRIVNDGSTPNTVLIVTADVLAVEGTLVESLHVSVDLTSTGKNGRAASFSRATNTWNRVWVGVHEETGEACAILDDTDDRTVLDTSHATLVGFTKWRRVGSWRTDGVSSGNFWKAVQEDDRTYYTELHASGFDYYLAGGVTGASGSTTPTTVSAAAFVPPTSRWADVWLLLNKNADSGTDPVRLRLRPVGFSGTDGTPLVDRPHQSSGNISYMGHVELPLTTSQQYQYLLDKTVTGSAFLGVYSWVTSYVDKL